MPASTFADLLATNLERADEVVLDTFEETKGYVFRERTVTAIVGVPALRPVYLTIDGGIARAEPYDPMLHVSDARGDAAAP